MTRTLAIGVLLAIAQGAQAALPATELKSELEASARIQSIGHGSHDEVVASGLAERYIQGVAEALGGSAICYPPEVTGEQAEAIVLKYLKEHPEKWHGPALISVVRALSDAFPCSAK